MSSFVAKFFPIPQKQCCCRYAEYPESREYYKAFIKNFFERNGNKLREDLEKLYIVRGENCQRLEQQGRALEYDRVAVLYVSLTVLNHYRSNTSVNHYIGK